MSLRYVVRVLALAALLPSGAMALGLGDIHLKSALNSPLNAEIDLSCQRLRNSPDSRSRWPAARASTRYGLDYPSYLDSVTLVPGKSGDGHDVLLVRSRDVVTEPFATLLVEANWTRGRLVREYTVLARPARVHRATSRAPRLLSAQPTAAAPQAHAGSGGPARARRGCAGVDD